ncbi:DUF5316 family protein [Fictibacillus iocasae]|uniref:DUF5316 family protein n=1 Tax=Fictibacillus iocasae TaxID=2715437 RepID=A0ABW2NQA0_9BACL
MLNILLIIGAVSIAVSGIFLGAWTNGQQQRANFHSETSDHRNFRTKIALYSGLVGVLSFGAAGLVWYL